MSKHMTFPRCLVFLIPVMLSINIKVDVIKMPLISTSRFAGA